MRMHGHAAHDDMRYVPVELIEQWRRRDPIELQERRLAEIDVDVAAVRAAVEVEIEAGVREALEMPMPDPATATEEALAAAMPDPACAVDGVFCEAEAEVLGDGQAPWSGFRAESSDGDNAGPSAPREGPSASALREGPSASAPREAVS